MKLLAAIPIAIFTFTLSLVIQLNIEVAEETEAYSRYYVTLIGYSERVVDKSGQLIELQAGMIEIQRRIIGRLGHTPCVERSLLAFNSYDSYIQAIPRR